MRTTHMKMKRAYQESSQTYESYKYKLIPEDGILSYKPLRDAWSCT